MYTCSACGMPKYGVIHSTKCPNHPNYELFKRKNNNSRNVDHPMDKYERRDSNDGSCGSYLLATALCCCLTLFFMFPWFIFGYSNEDIITACGNITILRTNIICIRTKNSGNICYQIYMLIGPIISTTVIYLIYKMGKLSMYISHQIWNKIKSHLN